MNEQDTLIRERLNTIFPSAEAAARIASLIASKRPVGVTRKCYYPYYREYYAMQIKESIDKQILTRERIVWLYAEFCPEISENSLYCKVNQSIRYLIDFLDPNGTYAMWRKVVDVKRDKVAKGIVIDYILEFRKGNEGKSFGGTMVQPRETTTPKWRIEMDNWLESDSTKPFHVRGLLLSEKEIIDLKMELKELVNLLVDVKAHEISIVRIN